MKFIRTVIIMIPHFDYADSKYTQKIDKSPKILLFVVLVIFFSAKEAESPP